MQININVVIHWGKFRNTTIKYENKPNLNSNKDIIPSYVNFDEDTNMILDYPSPHFNYKVQYTSHFPGTGARTSRRGALEAHGIKQPKTITATEFQLTNIINQSSKLVHNQNCLHQFKKNLFPNNITFFLRTPYNITCSCFPRA